MKSLIIFINILPNFETILLNILEPIQKSSILLKVKSFK